MKIYLDIFFAVNFLMNLLIFEIMNLFLKRKPINRRTLLASAMGGAAAVFFVFVGIKEYALTFVFMYLLVSALMSRIAYGKTTAAGMCRYLGGFYLTGVFVAGTMLSLRSLMGGRSNSMLFLLGSVCLILFAAKKIQSMASQTMKSPQGLFAVTLQYHGKKVTGTGFLDTGNQLFEPVSHSCVTVVEYKLFQKMLTETERRDFEKAVYEQDAEMFGKLLLRYIPFHSLGTDSGYLPGLRVEDIEIQFNDRERIHTGETWVGLSNHFLSADSGYEMLLNSKLFQK